MNRTNVQTFSQQGEEPIDELSQCPAFLNHLLYWDLREYVHK